jgi:hypothetical protein
MPFRGGDGGARQHHNHLPHVTPSPRVPALPAPRSASFALITILTGFPKREGGSAGRKPPSASRHSFPKSTCSAAFLAAPLSRSGIPAGFHERSAAAGPQATICLTSPFPKTTCSACAPRGCAPLHSDFPAQCSHIPNKCSETMEIMGRWEAWELLRMRSGLLHLRLLFERCGGFGLE